MRRIIQREKLQQISERKKIRKIQPEASKVETIYDVYCDKVQNLDRSRRVVAFNTLKAWSKKIRDKKVQRSNLMQVKVEELNQEEGLSNSLLVDYYQKMSLLKDLKAKIEKAQRRNEEMKAE